MKSTVLENFTILEFDSKDEWLDYRRTKVTATDFAVFMASKGLSTFPFGSLIQTLRSKAFGEIKPDNPYMKAGRENESRILEQYVLDNWPYYTYHPVVVQHNRYPECMATLDGLDKSRKSIAEVKFTTKHRDYWPQLLDYYKWQGIHQCKCTDIPFKDHVIIMQGENEETYEIYTLEELILPGDKEHIMLWKKYCDEFLEKVQSFRSGSTEEDVYIDTYIEIDTRVKELEESLKKIKQYLVDKHPEGLHKEKLTLTAQVRSVTNYAKFVKDKGLEIPDGYSKVTESYVVRIKK